MSAIPPNRMRPLDIGSVVTAGFSLYRSHFKSYIGLSGQALLWSLVPVYGWAKSATIAAQIGRLGFQELIHQPESVATAREHVERRLWSFLGAGIIVGLLLFAVNFGLSVVGTIVLLPLSAVLSLLGDGFAIVSALLSWLLQLAILSGQIWVQGRLLVYDIAIALEPETDETGSLSRSWTLSQGSGFRIQGVLFITYLIMLPLFVLAMMPMIIVLSGLIATASDTSDPWMIFAWVGLILLVTLVLLIVLGIVIMPLMQSIKAVLYYDLRARREGFDLQVNPRDQGT